MTVICLTIDNYQDILSATAQVAMVFTADWCVPCRTFKVVFATVASLYPEISFCEVDVEKEVALAQIFAVKTIPGLLLFQGRTIVHAESGALTQRKFEDLLLKMKEIS